MFSQGVSVVSWDVVRVDIVRVWMWSLVVVSVGVITRCSQCGYGHPGCGQGIWVRSVRCVWSVGVGMLTVGMGRVWSVAVGMVSGCGYGQGVVSGCGYGQGVVSRCGCGYGQGVVSGCGYGLWVWVWSVDVGMVRVWSVDVGMVRVWSVDVGMVCGCGYGQGVVSQGLHFVRASLVLVLTVLFRNLITK